MDYVASHCMPGLKGVKQKLANREIPHKLIKSILAHCYIYKRTGQVCNPGTIRSLLRLNGKRLPNVSKNGTFEEESREENLNR